MKKHHLLNYMLISPSIAEGHETEKITKDIEKADLTQFDWYVLTSDGLFVCYADFKMCLKIYYQDALIYLSIVFLPPTPTF